MFVSSHYSTNHLFLFLLFIQNTFAFAVASTTLQPASDFATARIKLDQPNQSGHCHSKDIFNTGNLALTPQVTHGYISLIWESIPLAKAVACAPGCHNGICQIDKRNGRRLLYRSVVRNIFGIQLSWCTRSKLLLLSPLWQMTLWHECYRRLLF